MPHDVIVVGGGAAGLAAALVLGRARRRTLVVDAGRPRNAPSPASHGVFTRDGAPPLELLREAREQLAPYSSVSLCDAEAVGARAVDGGFELELANGGRARARRLLLAVGVRDELPAVDGLAPLWGTRVLHCPYCHGWEVRDRPLAAYVTDRAGLGLVTLLLGWSRDVLVCERGAILTTEERELFAARGVGIVDGLAAVRPDGDGVALRLADGRTEWRQALFVRTAQVIGSPLPAMLGCDLTDAGLIRTGADRQTSVGGVYAAGDAAGVPQQVLLAAASGAEAAMMLNRDLAEADLRS